MDEELKKYRQSLLDTIKLLNESYDKLLIALSGGAIGLSMTFLKDVIKLEDVKHPEFVFLAWFAFICSLTAVLGRIMFGIEANRKAVNQVDQGKIHSEEPGGVYSKFTRWLYVAAASFLICGLTLIAIFANANVGA